MKLLAKVVQSAVQSVVQSAVIAGAVVDALSATGCQRDWSGGAERAQQSERIGGGVSYCSMVGSKPRHS